MTPKTGGPVTTFRELHSWDDYAEGVAIQKETWGAPFTEIVPASILMISQKVGGISAGAFGQDGDLALAGRRGAA